MDQLRFRWTVLSGSSLLCPHLTSLAGANLEVTTISNQWTIMHMYRAWMGELITIFLSHCHFLLFHLFFVEFFYSSSASPFVFDLSRFLCIAQTWKWPTRELNGKGLFSRILQIPNEIKKADYKHLIHCPTSCSVCEGDRKPRAGQSNPRSKQICWSKKIRRKRNNLFLSCFLPSFLACFLCSFFPFFLSSFVSFFLFYFQEPRSSAKTESYLVFLVCIYWTTCNWLPQAIIAFKSHRVLILRNRHIRGRMGLGNIQSW